MIVSHKHKFIFVKTRKTAGTSVEIALSKICGRDDIITPISPNDELKRKEMGLLTAQNYNIPIKFWNKKDWLKFFFNGFSRPKYRNHMSCEDIASHIDKDIWNNYYKFTIDRNPFDKIVSLYYFLNGQKTYSNVSDFLMNGGLKNIHSYSLYSINNVLAVDKVYKFEELDLFEKNITSKLQLKEPFKLLEYKAKSKHREVKNYKEILDEKAIDMIAVMFAREIKLLGYSY
ncbi:MAG: sulfotransferase family 2 domain-containing protein [Bacteroidia bacterium]|nr:sulfotransferase family 2 domain-containing protein [Bacteroidia bacterium]NNC84691.1 sulfotransferase family 2 domain-containing protein [Bacteroidia bacterium]NNM15996.1 sulfotransferase family 2 domain-containing protein [Bacteroidia bacterium]